MVTGAASGLGRAIAVRLARDGWRIALADVDREGSRQTLAMVQQAGGSGRVESLDVAQLDQWSALRGRLAGDWEHLDLLVNNAGVCAAGEVGQMPAEDWRWLLAVNLHGAIHGCHALADWLKANPRGGYIINTASIAAFTSAPGMAAYNVSKAGVMALSETLYSELKPHGVGVTVLCPGFFESRLLHEGRFPDETFRRAALAYACRSPLSAQQVADAAVRAMHKKRLYVVLAPRARWFWYAKRLAPTTLLKIVGRVVAKYMAAARKEQRPC